MNMSIKPSMPTWRTIKHLSSDDALTRYGGEDLESVSALFGRS